jgi:hypothetical protein
MININLLNKIRNVSAQYHLPQAVMIYRPVTTVDGSGGINYIDRLVTTTQCRIVAKVFKEEQEGGGLAGNSKWEIIVPAGVDLMADDKIIIRDDIIIDRYFLVINTDVNQTEGIFTSGEIIERWS